ncbi:phosphatase PAP2 family protein [Nocardiopsis sediminis]|uniref:Phosphatase PAP2 family protein n=1 Tax=Nocardiopsis sediminis TaxID=1778267 RepID=A0ABV8FR81_9ACTN
MGAVWNTEVGVNLWFQALGQWLRVPMEVLTVLGSQLLLVPLLCLVFWSVDARTGARGLVLLTGSALVNGVLKVAFHGARPYWLDTRVRPMSEESSFGIPSGHVQTSVVAWGNLAAGRARPWAWWAAAILVAVVAVTRLYLGVHFLSDVLAGLAAGGLLLWAALRYEGAAVRRWRRRPLGAQIGLAFALAAVPAALAAAWQRLVFPGWAPPPQWAGPVPPDVAQHSLLTAFTAGGGLFGVLAGLSVLAARGWYSAAGTTRARAARFVIGIAVLLPLFIAVEHLPHMGGAIDAAARFAGAAAVALWGALGAPELFVRTGLAGRPGTERGGPGTPARPLP